MKYVEFLRRKQLVSVVFPTSHRKYPKTSPTKEVGGGLAIDVSALATGSNASAPLVADWSFASQARHDWSELLAQRILICATDSILLQFSVGREKWRIYGHC